MKISVGADHGAVDLRARVVAFLGASGHEVVDHGTDSSESVDYPDFASKVGHDVAAGICDFGILMCTNGVGMSIAANKIAGVRAALIHSEDDAFYARSHNNANVICMGQRHHTPYDAERYLAVFLGTGFEGGRHARRVGKFEESPAPESPGS